MSMDVPDGVHKLMLGSSFKKAAGEAYHTIKYDFKPASLEVCKESYVECAPSDETIISFPKIDASDNVKDVTLFKGSRKPHQKECLLIYNHETGEFTIEKLTHSIKVKQVRSGEEEKEKNLQYATEVRQKCRRNFPKAKAEAKSYPHQNNSDESAVQKSFEKSAVQKSEKSAVQKSEKSAIQKSEKSAVQKFEKSAVQKSEKSAVQKPEKSAVQKPEKSAVQKSETSTVQKSEKSTDRKCEKSSADDLLMSDDESDDSSSSSSSSSGEFEKTAVGDKSTDEESDEDDESEDDMAKSLEAVISTNAPNVEKNAQLRQIKVEKNVQPRQVKIEQKMLPEKRPQLAVERTLHDDLHLSDSSEDDD